MEPAVLVDAGGGLFGHIVVADHVVVATAAYFAIRPQWREVTRFRVYDCDFNAGKRLSDSLAFALDGRFEVSCHRHDGTCFGKSVGVCDFPHEHFCLGLLHPVDGACRARHDAGSERTQIELVEERMVENCNVHRRYAVGCGAFLLFYRHQHLHRIELFEKDHRGAVIDAAHNAQDAAETVEERHWNAYAVAAGEVLARPDPESVIGDAAVGELHTLGKAGGAGRILHVHDIIRLALGLTGEIVCKWRFIGESLHFVERVHAALFLFAKEEYALEVRIGGAFQFASGLCFEFRHQFVDDFHIVAIAITGNDEEIFRVGLLERKIHFL